MGKSSTPAPTPDPNIGIAALKQAELGESYLAFAKDAFKVSEARQVELDKMTKEVSDLQIGLGKENLAASTADRNRYNTVFKPIEDQFVSEATNYATPGKQAEAAAEAGADVNKAMADQKAATERNAAAVGINPTSGRYAGIERAGDTNAALVNAGAKNGARQAVRDKGLALKADVVNLGRGVPAMSAQAASIGMGANQSAVGMTQGANQNYMASTGIVQGGYSAGMQGYAGQANTLQNLHNSNVSVWQTQEQIKAQNSAGALGAVGSIFGMMLSDEDAKENKKPIADGEALKAVENMPVEEWNYKPGMGDGGAHIGTYAQDFQKQTGKGNGKAIAFQDAIGVTMKAVQDLSKKVSEIASHIGMGGQPQPAGA